MKKMMFLMLLLCSFGAARGGEFRFALLTDLHVTADSMAANDLSRAIDQINATSDLRFVIVTGDLTEQGDRASLRRAKGLLDGLRIPYYITSGNHETKWSESGATDFARIFGSDRFRMEYEGVLFLGFNTGPVIRMAEGHVAPQDLSWVEAQLAQAGREKPVLLVTHYPMQKGDVDNWYSVTDAVRTYNIRAFLGGHYHSNALASYDGIPGFICRSTLRAGEAVGGYTVLRVTADSSTAYEQKIGMPLQPWGGYSMQQTYYTQDISSYERPDFSMNARYPEVRERWMTSLGRALYGSPTLYQDRVYVGDDRGVLSCLNLADGKLLWQFASQGRIVGKPGAADGVVVFGSADGGIYGVDARRGTLRWKVTTPEAVLGAVTICDGVAYLGGCDHTFRALDLQSGVERWRFDGLKGYVETLPLLYENLVIFGAWDSHLYALDRKTGRLQWAWSDGRQGMHYSPAAVWPVATAGRLFITAPDRILSAIEVRSGRTLWRDGSSTVRETMGLSEDSLRIYAKTMRDSVVCFASQTDRAEKLWACAVGFGYEIAPSMPQEKGGVLFGGTMNGELYGIEAQSGKLLWRHKVRNSLINTVVPLSGSRCLFTSSAGIVGLLEITPKHP
ncbi:MAG: PQQ-binding-like beta-propeller repeat protein [Alistipes sp.]|nr:PQQ-binding-like beta-propeller repeat protein [Alistipes sp.]